MYKAKLWFLLIVFIFTTNCALFDKSSDEKAKKRRRRRRPHYAYQPETEMQSDISYYKERSPGVARVKPRSVLPNAKATEVIDGRLLRGAHQKANTGSLWTTSSRHNSMFAKVRDRGIGDILYIKLKEDIRAMLKKQKKRRRRGYFGRRRRRRRRPPMRRGQKSQVKEDENKQAAGGAAGAKKKKKRRRKRKKRGETIIAARIIDELPNNTYLIEGHKLVELNRTTREILVSGYVNVRDINKRSEVLSTKMADLTIDYIIVDKKKR